MINPNFHVNKDFREQVDKFMNNTFGALTQPFIRKKPTKNNTSVLALLMFHETRVINSGKSFGVLRYVIYTIFDNYVCTNYLACKKKQLKFMLNINMLRNVLTKF